MYLKGEKTIGKFLDSAYKIEKYKSTYNTGIHLILDPAFQEQRDCPQFVAPKVERKKGKQKQKAEKMSYKGLEDPLTLSVVTVGNLATTKQVTRKNW